MKNILMVTLFGLIVYLVYIYYVKYDLKIENFIRNPTKKKKRQKKKSHKYLTDYINLNQHKHEHEHEHEHEFDHEFELTENANDILEKTLNERRKSKIRTHVFMDIEIHNQYIGKIEFELFDDIVPYTVKNFLYMIKYKYTGSLFHRIIKNFIIQGGDYLNGNGTGSNSIYGRNFDDENFNIKHDSKYMLSMANSGPNTNGSQFFITLDELHNLDNKHVVFGIISNEDSIKVLETLGNVLTNINDEPNVKCLIANCGIINTNIDMDGLERIGDIDELEDDEI